MKTKHNGRNTRYTEYCGKSTAQRRQGFTVVEMMVTLVILMMLFGIIFVPLNQAFNFFQLGQTRTNLQQAARQTLDQISSDLRTAVRVFPNDIMPGITNREPYNNDAPYLVSGSACGTTDPDERVANTSRIDFIPAETSNGGVVLPVTPGKYLVTYYARRNEFNPQDADANPYDRFANPVLLFRAQSPIRDGNDVFVDGGDPNVDTSSVRYTNGECSPRGSLWLYQNRLDEPTGLVTTADREPNDVTAPASEVRALPLNVSLSLVDRADPPTNLTPMTTFICIDSNNDGKIDQVKVNLALEETVLTGTANNSGQRPDAQRVRMSTTVDLPNVM